MSSRERADAASSNLLVSCMACRRMGKRGRESESARIQGIHVLWRKRNQSRSIRTSWGGEGLASGTNAVADRNAAAAWQASDQRRHSTRSSRGSPTPLRIWDRGEILRKMPRLFLPHTKEQPASHAPTTRVIGKRNVCKRVRYRLIGWSWAQAIPQCSLLALAELNHHCPRPNRGYGVVSSHTFLS